MSKPERAIRGACVGAAIGLALAVGLTYGQILVPSRTHQENKEIVVSGVVAGDWTHWMTVEAHNGKEFAERGFDPCYTNVVTDYKPVVHKLPDGKWEIQFTSEIAEGLP